MTPRSPTPDGARAWLASGPARDVVLNLVIAGACWLVGELTLLAAGADGRMAPAWPAAGIAVAGVWLVGARLLPGVAAGSLLLMLPRVPLPVAALLAAGTVLEAWIDVALLRRLGFDERLERTRDPLLMTLVAAPAGAAVSAAAGAAALAAMGVAPAALTHDALIWWIRSWLGVVVGLPLVLTWARGRPIDWTRRRVAELLALAVVVLALSQVVLAVWAALPGRSIPLAFALFPIVGWAGLRFRARGAVTTVAIATAFAIPIVAHQVGPFAGLPQAFSTPLVFTFLTLATLSGLLLSALVSTLEESVERRLALEEQLRHSQKMEAVGRLAGGIAHDFNNLLTAIIGYNEIVLAQLPPGDEIRADAEEIGRAAMRAADLTRQMLAFSRRQVLQPKVIDLNTALAKVEPMLRRVIGEDIVMTIAPRATRGLVRVDPGQIEQVIMNLVVNARDAMPQGGRLTVETGDATVERDSPGLGEVPAGAYVMLAVTDTGTGMSAEVKARIFEPYFTTKDVGKGTGLGLSTAYGIIRQSDGHVHVYSEPGLGTTFRVYLPRAEAEAVAAAEETGQGIPGGTEHILLVEDDTSVRRLSKEILVRLGYSVTEAASGRAGLALGSDDTRHFDLALCDVILGDMSGPAVVEALRALRPSVRVLYMSGYTDEAIVRTGVLDEGQPFLQKPFTPMDLARKIREVLETPED
ncbi:MAG: MASE1 domain-containing protein [Vicinamibacterales bacterium]